jgi:hypothetical protein
LQIPNSINGSSISTVTVPRPAVPPAVRIVVADCTRRTTRKPRGWLIALGEEHDLRFSFCCAVDSYRDRATPPSLRFLGRKVYLATIVILISAMCNGLTERRLCKLAEAIGVDRRTVARWRSWWLKTFTITPFWRARWAEFMPPVERDHLPAALLSRFAGDAGEQLASFLSFLGPIPAGASMQTF